MKIIVTAKEVLEKGGDVWEEFCAENKINLWAISEGLMYSDEEFTLSEEEAIKYGFIKKEDTQC